MDKLKMESVDLTAQNIEKIGALFPNCITETTDENGKLKKAINFDMLKQMLSDEVAEGDEAYEFTWVGKKEAIVEANKPIRKTLRPCKEESVDWDSTENLYIEGDNLEVLKLLQESYLGKVKMIYIDPPYNTGSDKFIYTDDFHISKEEYEKEAGYKNEDGEYLFKENLDSNPQFHSVWCSMIYSRLMLARNLLSEDGVIFISIGDEEVDNLRKIADEIFGADNFRNEITVRRGAKSIQAQFDTWEKLGKDFEYILFYTKNASFRFKKQLKPLNEKRNGSWNNHWRGTDRPTMRYPLLGITPTKGQWRWGKERSENAVKNYKLMIADIGSNPTQEQIDNWYEMQNKEIDLLRLSSNGKPEHYIPPTNKTLLNSSWNDLLVGSSSEILNLFKEKVFDTAKLTSLIERMIKFVDKDAIILDFFSGSATTAHAVMQLNVEEIGNGGGSGCRKFIMVQLPEKTDEKSEAFKAGYKNICEIGKERIRRAGKKIKEENQNATNLDIGFRVLKLAETNMTDVYYSPLEINQQMLLEQEENIKPDRTDLDLLFGCLLDWGIPLNLPYVSEQIDGFTVHTYNNGDLIACFDKNVSESVIKEIAKRQPLRAVFRDSSFADSPSKINVGEIFKMIAPDTRVRVI